MARFGSWRFSGGAALVALAVLLCLWVSLSWCATGPDAPASLRVGHSPQMEQGANGHPLEGSYLAVSAEEKEEGDKGPVKAGLLTALLLAFFFGMALGWRFTDALGREASCSSGVAQRLRFVPRQELPSLGVFRL